MNIKYQCPCCGYYTFDEPVKKTYDICPICFWEDDGDSGAANGVSLLEARQNFKMYAACTPSMISKVRYARPDDKICADIIMLLTDNRNIDETRLTDKYNVIKKSKRFCVLADKNSDELFGIVDILSGYAYVMRKYADAFSIATKELGLSYLVFESLDERNLICSDIAHLPEDIYNMHDENFFEACFSIKELVYNH